MTQLEVFVFTKDSRTENFLNQMGVSFRYTNNVAFSNLELGWDSYNLARPIPLREDAIIEYATLMESGSAAPAPILHDREGGYPVLDGVQRLAATRLSGETKFSAYVVECDSEDMVAAIRVLANARLQGRAEPAEWTRRRAVEVLVLQRGLTPDEVARMGGWRPADVARLAAILEWSGKICRMGGPELPDKTIELVSAHLTESELSAAPEPIAEFLGLIKTARFSSADAEPYIKEFFSGISKPTRRHRIYVERLDSFKNDPEVQTRIHGRRGVAMARDVVLLRMLKSADTVLDEIVADGESLPYVDEFFRLIKKLDAKLKSIAPNQKAVSARVPADMWGK